MNSENEIIAPQKTKNESWRNRTINSSEQLSDFINAVLEGNPLLLSPPIIDYLIRLAKANLLPLPPTHRNNHSIFMRPVRAELKDKNMADIPPESSEHLLISNYRLDIFALERKNTQGSYNQILRSNGRGKFERDPNGDIIVTYQPYKGKGKALRSLRGKPDPNSSNRIKHRPTERLIQAQEKYPNRGVYPICNLAEKNSGIPSTALIMPFYPFSLEDKLDELSPLQRQEAVLWLLKYGQDLFNTQLLQGDIKPQNIMLTTFDPSVPLSDKLRLLDWDDASYIEPRQTGPFDPRLLHCGSPLYRFIRPTRQIEKHFIFYHDFHAILFSIWEILLPKEFKNFEIDLEKRAIICPVASAKFPKVRVETAIEVLNKAVSFKEENSLQFLELVEGFRTQFLFHLRMICPENRPNEFNINIIQLDKIAQWYQNFIDRVPPLEQNLATLDINEISPQLQLSPR